MISCGVLVARIVCNALRGGRILQYSGQLIGNFKIDVRIQMTIGSQGCLYFSCPRRSLINRGFSPMLMSREAWECLSAWILIWCTPASLIQQTCNRPLIYSIGFLLCLKAQFQNQCQTIAGRRLRLFS